MIAKGIKKACNEKRYKPYCIWCRNQDGAKNFITN